MAEALGEEKSKLRSIVEKIENVKKARTACKIIREEDNIPFERILFLVERI